MSNVLPLTYLARHGETAWTISRQHTGSTDLPLTVYGEAEARLWGEMPHEPGIGSIQAPEQREKARR